MKRDMTMKDAMRMDREDASSPWRPIALAPKGRTPDGRLLTVLLVGIYPMNGSRTHIIEDFWIPGEERWARWDHPFEPSYFMYPPALPVSTSP